MRVMAAKERERSRPFKRLMVRSLCFILVKTFYFRDPTKLFKDYLLAIGFLLISVLIDSPHTPACPDAAIFPKLSCKQTQALGDVKVYLGFFHENLYKAAKRGGLKKSNSSLEFFREQVCARFCLQAFICQCIAFFFS